MPRRRQVCNKKCGERAVGDAGPYGEVTRSAVRRDDVGIVPYGGFQGVQGYIGWNYRVRLG